MKEDPSGNLGPTRLYIWKGGNISGVLILRLLSLDLLQNGNFQTWVLSKPAKQAIDQPVSHPDHQPYAARVNLGTHGMPSL